MKVPISLAALFALATPLFAGTPRLLHIFPAGAQRGGEIEITCTGSNLNDPREFLFELPGFTVTDISATGNKVTAKVKVAADAKLGEHRLRLVTQSGISDVRLFFVSPFPLVAEIPPTKEELNPVQPIALGTTVYGHTPNDDQDTFEVEAKKGQRISAEVIGVRVQTQNIYDPAITIAKQIDYLGAMPNATAKPVKLTEDAKGMLRADLDNENQTIRAYRERVLQCDALGEFAIGEEIREILRQEQEHQMDLATALGEDVPDVSKLGKKGQ